MRVFVLGAGCVGGVIAERISANGSHEVGLVASGVRRERLLVSGLVVNGRRLDLPVVDGGVEADLLVVCVKNYQLADAVEDARGVVGPETVILPLLNGVTATTTLAVNFPANDVLYGYITKIDAKRKDGAIRYNVAGDLHLGHAMNDGLDVRLSKLEEMFLESGFECSVDRDMRRGVWRKWMLNIGANQVSALTRADYLQFARVPQIREILRRAMGEVLEVAHAEGVDLRASDVEELVEYLMTYPFPKLTSMLQDVLAGRRTEIEDISGDLVRIAERHGVSCPVNETMYLLISSLQATYLEEDTNAESHQHDGVRTQERVAHGRGTGCTAARVRQL